jgi:hypothetical protein
LRSDIVKKGIAFLEVGTYKLGEIGIEELQELEELL